MLTWVTMLLTYQVALLAILSALMMLWKGSQWWRFIWDSPLVFSSIWIVFNNLLLFCEHLFSPPPPSSLKGAVSPWHQRPEVCVHNYGMNEWKVIYIYGAQKLAHKGWHVSGSCDRFIIMLCACLFRSVYFQSELRICVLPTHVTYDAPWPIRKVPLRCTPHFLCYHPDSKVCMFSVCGFWICGCRVR